MFQEIVIAQGPSLTLELPAELVGKRIRVVAFEEHEGQRLEPTPSGSKFTEEERARRIADIQAITAGHRVDLSKFVFNRDWANDYDAE